MKENFDSAFEQVMKSEGGFVNDPRDPGGMTNHGVTKKVWEAYVGHEVDEEAMRSLTLEDVKPLYRKNYWDAVDGDSLPSGVDYAVFDVAVNSGVGRAAKFLQQAVGVEADGQIGPHTLSEVNAQVPEEIAIKVCDTRMRFLESLPTFEAFGHGWTNRVESVKALSIQMAMNPPAKQPEPDPTPVVAQVDPLTEAPAVEADS